MTDSRGFGVSEAPLGWARSVHRRHSGLQLAANPSTTVVPGTSRKPRGRHRSPSAALNDPSCRLNIGSTGKGGPGRLPRCPLPSNPLTCAVGRVSGASDADGRRSCSMLMLAKTSRTVQGTFYGNNGWAGACAGLVPQTGQPWPPPGGSYQNNMQPGSSTPINVAINSAQWSVPMVRVTPDQPTSVLGSAPA